MTRDGLAELLRSAVVLPVLRTPDRAGALVAVERCVAAGLPVVELTATTTDWADALREVRAAWPDLVVGVGSALLADPDLTARLGVLRGGL
jgi:2-dehydro-3-deoxyphosphogluconate aldolase/(4S)-4-hydroxy-2-oxoglutarate aldolase